jgi:hypothetical protein
VLSELQTASVTIGILTACVSVVIGVANSIMSNRRAEKQRELTQQTQQLTLETRQAQLFMQVYNAWSSADVVKSYGFLRYQYPDIEGEKLFNFATEPYDAESFMAIHCLNQYFEGIAVLVETGLLDIKLVENLFSRRIIWFWERMETMFTHVRKRLNDPTQYDSLERLYHEMKKREQQQATPSS